jgi:hypothetical protein
LLVWAEFGPKGRLETELQVSKEITVVAHCYDEQVTFKVADRDLQWVLDGVSVRHIWPGDFSDLDHNFVGLEVYFVADYTDSCGARYEGVIQAFRQDPGKWMIAHADGWVDLGPEFEQRVIELASARFKPSHRLAVGRPFPRRRFSDSGLLKGAM